MWAPDPGGNAGQGESRCCRHTQRSILCERSTRNWSEDRQNGSASCGTRGSNHRRPSRQAENRGSAVSCSGSRTTIASRWLRRSNMELRGRIVSGHSCRELKHPADTRQVLRTTALTRLGSGLEFPDISACFCRGGSCALPRFRKRCWRYHHGRAQDPPLRCGGDSGLGVKATILTTHYSLLLTPSPIPRRNARQRLPLRRGVLRGCRSRS